MKLTGFEYNHFTAGLKSPFKNSASLITHREGYYISITNGSEYKSLGEVSPLPGLSTESINRTESELLKAKEFIPVFEEAKDSASLRRLIEDIEFSRSVRFGIEQAMIGLLSKSNHSLFAEYFNKASHSVPVNAVADLNDNALIKIKEKIKSGFSTVKIKIGRSGFEDDLLLIKEIRSHFGNLIKLRLDVNGKWNFEEAKMNLAELEPFNIEYVEEPCGGLENITALSRITSISLAVDESLKQKEDAEYIIKESPISFVVIKPMIIGGFFGTADLISLANEHGKHVIISSAFETPVGKSLLVLLAAISGHSYAHGLDTAELFSEVMFDDPYPVEKGEIHFSPDSFPPSFKPRHT